MADDNNLADLSLSGFRIGEWQVHPTMNRIVSDDRSVVLEPKVMDVLVCLARRGGSTVTKEQFMTEVWGGTVVTDDVLSRCISELRKALDDDWRDPRVIETIRKTGYRLVAPVHPLDIETNASREPRETNGSHDSRETNGSRDSRETNASRDPGDGSSTLDQEVPETLPRSNAHTSSSATDSGRLKPARPGSRHRLVLLALFASLVLVLILILVQTKKEPAPPVPIPFTSAPGLEIDASLSPDGTQVAFASDNGSGRDFDIYISQDGAEIPLRLTDSAGDERQPTWSPDGLRLAFVSDKDGTEAIYIIPSIGGPPRKVADFGDRQVSDLAWSGEAGLIGIAAQTSKYGPSAIHLLSEDSVNVRQVTVPSANSAGDRSVSFSPDGTELAFVRAETDVIQDIFVVSVDGGEPRQITFDSTVVAGLVWRPDDDEIVFASKRNGASGIWRIDPSGGDAEWILSSNGGSRLQQPSVARTAARLVYVEWTSDVNLWRLWRQSEREAYRAHPLVFSTRWDSQPDIAPDGERLAYASEQSGQREIWVSDGAGANRTQLTESDGVRNSFPRWSPDGSELAFVASRRGQTEIRIVSESGSGASSIGGSPNADAIPAWSRDGASVYFSSNTSGRPEIWRARRDSGATVQVTYDGGVAAMESVDGKSLYYVRPDTTGIWRLPLAGKPPVSPYGELVVDSLDPGDLGNWSVQADGIYHVRRRPTRTRLLFYSFQSKTNSVVAPLHNLPKTASLAVAPDRSWIVVSQEDDKESDVMLLEPFN